MQPPDCSGGGSSASGAGGLRRGAVASATAVCASIASLVSKNPALRRTGKALARCGGEDFVAAILASAVALPGWHRDPKRCLIRQIGCVADEAARALQDFWRQRLCARAAQRQPVKVCGGYQQLVLAAPRTRGGVQKRGQAAQGPDTARLPQTDRREQRSRPPSLTQTGGQTRSSVSSTPPSLPSPRQPETPRNKSNPRPVGGRGVPMNPIQALKHRQKQQQQEAEEKRLREMQEAEERRGGPGSIAVAVLDSEDGSYYGGWSQEVGPASGMLALPSFSGGGEETVSSSPSTPRCLGSNAQGRPPMPPGGSEEVALTPLERRKLRQQATPQSPRGSPEATSLVQLPTEEEVRSAPATLEGWRRSGSKSGAAEKIPRASSASDQCSSVSATERLKARMSRPDGTTGGESRRDRSDGDAPCNGWRERIEARQREASEFQGVEEENKQRTSERSNRRNDAMRRVMERQAQRQDDVVALEA